MTSSINLAKYNSSKLDQKYCKNRENLVINIHWYCYRNSLIVCKSMLKYIMVTGNVIPSFVRLPSKVWMHFKNQEYLENGENLFAWEENSDNGKEEE